MAFARYPWSSSAETMNGESKMDSSSVSVTGALAGSGAVCARIEAAPRESADISTPRQRVDLFFMESYFGLL